MSDDRYNDPSRHPMHNPQNDGYGEEEDKTQMVEINKFGEPNFAPPPTMDAGEATQLFEIPPSMSGGGSDDMMSSAPDYGSSFGSQSDSFSSAPDYGQDSAPTQLMGPNPNMGAGHGMGAGQGMGSGPQQVYVGGEDPGYEGHTQFVNIADFAQEPAHFTPEQQQAGYDGNTQFVDINALMSGGPQASGPDPIDNDRVLNQGYQFNKNHIHRGDVTTIRANNPLGKQVILKRVWEGDPQSMSAPLRQRVAQLNELNHPNLVSMNGMFVSESGMWVELDAPKGIKLEQVLLNQGPRTREVALEWLSTLADTLSTIHSHQLAYANLTPDSIWVDLNENSIEIEPFDMLRLADRGNLGEFGGEEMNVPPDQRQLSPSTDVFSLAAIFLVLLKGMPFDRAKIEQIDDKALQATLQKALAPQQADRFQSIDEFVAAVKKGGGLDIKVVGAIGASVMILLLVALAMLGGGDDGQQSEQQPIVAAPTESAEVIEDGENADGEEVAEAEESLPDVELPGDVTSDPRLNITVSYASNPPEQDDSSASQEELEEWRTAANAAIEEGDSARRDADKWEHYDEALQLLTRVIRNQPEPPASDWQAYHDLVEKDVVTEEMKKIRDEFDTLLEEGRFRSMATRYRQTARRDPRANAAMFFQNTTSAEIEELTLRSDTDPDGDDSDEGDDGE